MGDYDSFTLNVDAHGIVADNLGAHTQYLNILWDDDTRAVRAAVQVTYDDLTEGSCNMHKLRTFTEKEPCCDNRIYPSKTGRNECFAAAQGACSGPVGGATKHLCCTPGVNGKYQGFDDAAKCFEAKSKCPPLKKDIAKKNKGAGGCERNKGGYYQGKKCASEPSKVCDNPEGCTGFAKGDATPDRWPLRRSVRGNLFSPETQEMTFSLLRVALSVSTPGTASLLITLVLMIWTVSPRPECFPESSM